jgi:uncharacterized protein HemX
MDGSDENEFYADFGEPAPTDEQLAALLERARSSGDADLRLLVKQYAALRRTIGWLLDELDRSVDVAAVRGGETARIARFLVSAERPDR